MIKQFKDPTETILYQEKIKKVSSWGVNQTRTLIITEQCIYLFEEKFMKGMQISRTYEITDLAAVIRSTEST